MTSSTSNSELDLATQPLDHGLVVQANAGTGKTYSITNLVAREISKPLAAGARPAEIEDFLIVTFTNNAASDLRVRVREQLEEKRRELQEGPVSVERLAVERALGSLDRASISTIHQFCGSILRLAGLPLSEVVETRIVDGVIDAVASDMVVNRSEAGLQGKDPVSIKKLSEFLHVMLSNPDLVLDGLTTSNELTRDLTQLVQESLDEVHRRLEQSLTHDETIRRAVSLLDHSNKGDGLLLDQVRKMYRYCIIDESQDTDKEQWRLFKLIFPDDANDGRALIVVGDPKQSIYAFRGADVGAYLEAIGQRPPLLLKELTTNYRSDDNLVEALNIMLKGSKFGGIPNGAVIDYRKVKSNKPPTEIFFDDEPTAPVELIAVDASQQSELIDDTVKQVASLLSGRYRINNRRRNGVIAEEIEAQDIAVLVRSGNLGRKIQAALLAKSIPAVSNSTESVADGETFEAFVRLASAFQRPSDDGRVRRVAMSVFFNVHGRDDCLMSEKFVTGLQQKLERWCSTLNTGGIAALALAILEERSVRDRFLATAQGERHLTDFNQIVEFIESMTTGEPLSARSFAEALVEIRKVDHVANELAARRVESDDAAVQISTIHSTKGLQFPIVLVVDPWKSGLKAVEGPRIVRRGSTQIPGRGRTVDVGYLIGNMINKSSSGLAKDAYRQLLEDNASELKRLFYVAVTRAQHHLTIVCPTEDTLAIRHQLTKSVVRNKKKVEEPQFDAGGNPITNGCLDLGTADGSIPTTVPAALKGLLRIGGLKGVFQPMKKAGRKLVVSPTVATPVQVRERTSFTQIKKKLETPDIERSHVFTTEDFVRDDDEFESSTGRDEGDLDSKSVPLMPLWGLPKGKNFGTALHYVFEHLDPTAPDLPAEVARVVDAHVSPAMLEGHRENLIAGLLQVLETPMGPLWGERCLKEIPKSSRLEEIRFSAVLPEGDSFTVPNTKEIGGYISSRIAPNDPLHDYGLLLATSDNGVPLRGALTGSIDALLHLSDKPHKFLISDYKSNWLRDPSDEVPLERYSPENLWAAMTRNHYQLQALIYGVAAYRYLRSRGMSSAEADSSVSGFAYLFVRGILGSHHTPLQTTARLGYFVGQRYGISSWSSTPYPTFWSGLSDVLLGAS